MLPELSPSRPDQLSVHGGQAEQRIDTGIEDMMSSWNFSLNLGYTATFCRGEARTSPTAPLK
jgi:hypothetical protein